MPIKTAAVIRELIGSSPFVYAANRQQDDQIQKVYLWVNQRGNIEYETESCMTLRKDARPCDIQYGIGIPIRAVEREENSTNEYKLYVDNGGEIQCEKRTYNDGARCMSSLFSARSISPIPEQNIHALQKLNWIENLDILSFDKVIEHYTKDPGTVFDCRFYAGHYQFIGTFSEVLKVAGNSKWDLLVSDLVYGCEWCLHNGDTSWRP